MATNVNTKQAIAEINKLIDSFNSLVTATGGVATVSQGNFKKVEHALAALKIMSDEATAAVKKMDDAQKQQLASTRAREKAVTDVTDALKKEADAIQKVVDNQKKLDDATKKTTGFFNDLWNSSKQLIAAFGVLQGLKLFAAILKDAFELTKTFDSLSFALKKVTEDSFNAASSQRFLIDLTQKFGVELVSTTERWIKFLAASKQAGITLMDTEKIFTAVTKAAAVLGLGTDDLRSVYLALEQMMSKGKVTTEELRRQLGEKLPGAVGIMAAAVGVNVNQLDKMLKKGEVLSAEVLPKFADALEAAYGIQNIEKIDNITSAQGRLTNAWSVFVKSVTEGQGVIAQTINGMAILLNKTTALFFNEEQKLQAKVLIAQKDFQDQYEFRAEEFYNSIVSKEENMAYLRNMIYKKQKELEEATGMDRVRLQKQLDEYQYSYALGTQKILNIQKARAAREIENAKEEYKIKKALFERFTRAEEDVPENVRNAYAFATARLDYLRKLLEVNTASAAVEEPKKKKTPATKYLDNINDLTNEEETARLTAQRELNDELIKGDEASYQQRIDAMVANGDIRIQLADTQYKEALEKAKLYHDKEINELDVALKKGNIIIGDQVKYRKDIEKNYRDQTLIATTNHNKAILANEKQFTDDSVAIAKRAEQLRIRDVDDSANKRIILAQQEYNASEKLAKDKAKLDRTLNEIAIEQANAVIDVQIKTLENMLEMSGLSEEIVNAIKSQILKLQASKKLLFPDEKDIKQTRKNLEELLEFIGKSSQAITDLGDAVFDRKIENINAEINAEKDKYDRLIGLAANNKDEQVRLQTEKDAKIKALEDKRLKEEQKKAKFDKANALVQIAINTALAAMKAAAQTGVGSFVTVPLIIALGAVQAAAVLAQPIPKYKDGLKSASKDHIGLINDGGKQEFIERGNSILTTTTKDAIVNLKKGDTVHKSYEDMANNSDVFNNLSRSIYLNSLNKGQIESGKIDIQLGNHLKNIESDIKKGIRDGFRNVTINNTTKIDMEWLRYKNDTL